MKSVSDKLSLTQIDSRQLIFEKCDLTNLHSVEIQLTENIWDGFICNVWANVNNKISTNHRQWS
jgi:hypothetical protein